MLARYISMLCAVALEIIRILIELSQSKYNCRSRYKLILARTLMDNSWCCFYNDYDDDDHDDGHAVIGDDNNNDAAIIYFSH